jgi:hypothetical protein
LNSFNKYLKSFLYILLVVVLIFSGLLVTVYVYQDKIIQIFVSEANSYIKTPVKVGSIKVSLFQKFPQASIVFDNVAIQESLTGSKETLAEARKIYCSFNLIDLVRGNYEVKSMAIENAVLNFKLLPDGKNNFTIIESPDERSKNEMKFNLKHIELKDVLFNFQNQFDDQEYSFHALDVLAGFNIKNDDLLVSLDGDLISNQIRVENNKYFEYKELKVKSVLHYNLATGSFEIKPSMIWVHNSPFSISGNYTNEKGRFIDIRVNAENADIQSILSVLPENIRKELGSYRSKGDVYLRSGLKGPINKKQLPALSIEFGTSNASFFHPDYKKAIEGLELKGSFVCSNLKSLKTARLELNKIRGNLDGRIFSGDFLLENFDDYFISTSFSADLSIQSILEIFPSKEISTASGDIMMNVSFKGKTSDFKKKHLRHKLKTSGDITIKDLSLKLKGNNLPFQKMNGNFLLKDNDLAVSNYSGEIGHSGFLINGLFKNVIPYLFYDKEDLEIEADLKSKFIDFDQLLFANMVQTQSGKSSGGTSNINESYSFQISPNLKVLFNCDIQKIKFQRFHAKDVKGRVDLNEQILKAKGVVFKSMGGNWLFNSSVNAKDKKRIKVFINSELDNINIDSIFYVFHNFNQTFLTDKNLKGKLMANINSDFIFNDKLDLDEDRMVVDAGILIQNGELNNFEPMQSLSKFVKSESLARMRFPELRNNIHIENRTVYLPEMVIRSNALSIFLQGHHTFDQRIDYKVKIPVKELIRANKSDRDFQEAVDKDDFGGMNLFLSIKGTTENYKISYDKDAVKNKIKADILKEGKELKEAIKNKENKNQKEKSVNEDEYFDF